MYHFKVYFPRFTWHQNRYSKEYFTNSVPNHFNILFTCVANLKFNVSKFFIGHKWGIFRERRFCVRLAGSIQSSNISATCYVVSAGTLKDSIKWPSIWGGLKYWMENMLPEIKSA